MKNDFGAIIRKKVGIMPTSLTRAFVIIFFLSVSLITLALVFINFKEYYKITRELDEQAYNGTIFLNAIPTAKIINFNPGQRMKISVFEEDKRILAEQTGQVVEVNRADNEVKCIFSPDFLSGIAKGIKKRNIRVEYSFYLGKQNLFKKIFKK